MFDEDKNQLNSNKYINNKYNNNNNNTSVIKQYDELNALTDNDELSHKSHNKNNLQTKKTTNKKEVKEKNNDINLFINSSQYCVQCIMILALLIMFIIVLVFVSKNVVISSRISVLANNNAIKKPLIDKNEYKVIRLENNLDALLISDKSTSKCGASITVNSGSFSDEKSYYGMAHLTEHLIFLGSKNFSSSSKNNISLENYTQSHFGSTNAYTQMDYTTYYFELNCNGFSTALDIFSDMFANPLLSEEYMDKEINAVNSENDKNLNNDGWKLLQLLKSLSSKDKDNKFNAFSTGNSKSLRVLDKSSLNKIIRQYVNDNYVPENMRLVLYSNKNIEDVKDLAINYFSRIPLKNSIKFKSNNKSKYLINNLYKNYSNIKPFNKNNLGKYIWWEKKSKGNSLDIMFYISNPDYYNYKSKPVLYISNIINFSGKGSLIEHLIKKDLSTKLSSDIIEEHEGFSIYSISLELTNKGLHNVNEVILVIFSYINYVKNREIDNNLYNEIKDILNINFQFSEKDKSIGQYLGLLSNTMFKVNYEDILSAYSTIEDIQEDLIKAYIKNNLTPENALIFIGSTIEDKPDDINFKFDLDRKNKYELESWYMTKYIMRDLNKNEISTYNKLNISLNNEFLIRPKNPYITKFTHLVHCNDYNDNDLNTEYLKKNFKNIENKDVKYNCNEEFYKIKPLHIINEESISLFYRMDRTFEIPKINNIWNIKINQFNGEEDYIYLNIFNLYLTNIIESQLGQAIEAGNSIDLKLIDNYISLTVNAYSDINEKIIETLINAISTGNNINEDYYNLYLELTKDNIEKNLTLIAYKKVLKKLNLIVKSNSFKDENLIKTIENIASFNNFKSRIKLMLNSLNLKGLLYGYYPSSYLNNYVNLIRKLYYDKNNDINIYNNYNHKLIDTSYIYINKNNFESEIDNVIINFYQLDTNLNIKSSLISTIIELIWEDAYYKTLRTEQQLGYIVASIKTLIDNVNYYLFIVQGAAKKPDYINIEIDKITNSFLKDKIESLTPAILLKIKSKVIAEINKRFVNLNEKSSLAWNEIITDAYIFDRREQANDIINWIETKDIKNMFYDVFYNKPRKLSIQIYNGQMKDFDKTVEDISSKEKYYYLNKNIKNIITDRTDMLKNNKDLFNK